MHNRCRWRCGGGGGWGLVIIDLGLIFKPTPPPQSVQTSRDLTSFLLNIARHIRTCSCTKRNIVQRVREDAHLKAYF